MPQSPLSLLPHAPPEIPGPLSTAALQRLATVESPNVTAISPEFPIVWQQAKGATVTDIDGNHYIDATSAFGVALIGHGNPQVVRAVRRQAATLLHAMGDVHPPRVRIELLERLAQLAPAGLGYGVLCTGGSEAIEVATKSALLFTGKPGIVAFTGAYHGLGHGALDLTSRRDFREPFWAQLAHNTLWVPFPNASHPPVAVASNRVVEHVLARVHDAICHPSAGGPPVGAVLIEPIQGRAGAIVPPAGFLRQLRLLCSQLGVLLIADEIMTGLGRTGAMWACDHEGVVPDLLCVGKALGGGMPIAACLGSAEVMAAWGPSRGEALHTSTFLGNPVACAAAVAALNVIESTGVAHKAQIQGRQWLALLHRRLAKHPAVAQIRGKGLMLAVEFQAYAGKSPRQLAWQVTVGALRRGVVVLPAGANGEVVQLTPPVVVSKSQRVAVVDALCAALDD